jgi:hypothetical protein
MEKTVYEIELSKDGNWLAVEPCEEELPTYQGAYLWDGHTLRVWTAATTEQEAVQQAHRKLDDLVWGAPHSQGIRWFDLIFLGLIYIVPAVLAVAVGVVLQEWLLTAGLLALVCVLFTVDWRRSTPVAE